MDRQGSDVLICPICGYEYDFSIEESRIKEGLGPENADTEQCEECNQPFMIVEYGDHYTLEVLDEEEEELMYYEDD